MNRKTVVQNLLLTLGSLFFAIIVAEIVLRVILPSPIIWKNPQEKYLFDPEIGFRLKPNQHAYTHDEPVDINSQGIRDAEYSSTPGMQVTRILALGDSQTFGNGLTLADTWPKQLERELNDRTTAGNFEVLNGGLPASDTWQHEILLQRLMTEYNPDIVILAFYVNDIVSRPAVIRHAQDDSTTPMDLRLVYLLKRSALLLSLRNAYDSLMQMVAPSRAFLMSKEVLAGVSNPEIDKRWEQVNKSLSAMKDLTETNNITFLVVSLPRRDQVDGRLPSEKYNQRLSAVMKNAGVRFINLLGPLQEAYKVYGKSLFIPWDGHNTAIANRVIAKNVAAAIPGLVSGRPEQAVLHGDNDGL